MIKKYLLLTFLLMNFTAANGQSFKEFTIGNYFAPINEKYLELTAVCRKNYDEKEKKKYFEILFYNQGKNIFDMIFSRRGIVLLLVQKIHTVHCPYCKLLPKEEVRTQRHMDCACRFWKRQWGSPWPCIPYRL